MPTVQPGQGPLERGCKIHGAFFLPDGYDLAYVPDNAIVKPFASHDRQREQNDIPLKCEVSSSNTWLKAIIAIFQIIYASFTLYRSRGDQIESYGYAAFGLTVIPYILMSILNLIGQIVTSEYPALYLVHSEEMDEAKRRDGVFEGAIGTLVPVNNKPSFKVTAKPDSPSPHWVLERITHATGNSDSQQPGEPQHSPEILQASTQHSEKLLLGGSEKSGRVDHFQQVVELYLDNLDERRDAVTIRIPSCSEFKQRQKPRNWQTFRDWLREMGHNPQEAEYLMIALSGPVAFECVLLLIVGLLSHFSRGQSTELQRGFIMSWWVIGIAYGFVAPFITTILVQWYRTGFDFFINYIPFLIFFIISSGGFLVPALGGFIVVGKEIIEFGTCIVFE